MKLWQTLLYPFSTLYRSVTAVRNELYDRKVYASTEFKVPVVVVGNLTVGGTGKTPHVAYLVQLMQQSGKHPAVISRGYGRKTRGFLLADASATAETIGDEPMTYVKQFPGLTVAVGEKRAEAIEQVLKVQPQTDVLLLDDAFQHRSVKGQLNLLLTDYGRLFTRDFVLPAGLLRESRNGAGRAHAVIVTKCQATLTGEEQRELKSEIGKYTKPGVPVFFTRYRYGQLIPIGSMAPAGKEVILVTGIAQPQPMEAYLREQGYQVREHFNFRDHHSYTEKDLKAIITAWESTGRKASIITTSKDAVKLQRPEWQEQLSCLPVFYLPIEVEFLSGEPAFRELINQVFDTRSGEIT